MVVIESASRYVPTADPDDTVEDVASRMNRTGAECVVVVRDGRPVGLITERHLAFRLLSGLEEGRDISRLRVRSIMLRGYRTLRDGERADRALDLMAASGWKEVVRVGPSGELSGLITLQGVLEDLGPQMGTVASRLRPSRLRRPHARPLPAVEATG